MVILLFQETSLASNHCFRAKFRRKQVLNKQIWERMGTKRYRFSDIYFGQCGKFTSLPTFWKIQLCPPSLMKILFVFFPFRLEALVKFPTHALPSTLETLDIWESNLRNWQLHLWCGNNLYQPPALGRIYVFLNSKVVKILQTLFQYFEHDIYLWWNDKCILHSFGKDSWLLVGLIT